MTEKDEHPGSSTSIDHADAANVPGYIQQYKERPDLRKYKNSVLFVDHKAKIVCPSFQETKTGEE
jgi:hypothetical protein